MDYFEEKAEERGGVPAWVKKSNASYVSYKKVMELYFERLEYIRSHNRKNHFKRKKDFQVSGSEVARAIGIAKTTLLISSSYSPDFVVFLQSINDQLQKAKSNRLYETEKSYSRGPVARPKDRLVQEVNYYKSRVKVLEERNAIAQVEEVFSCLHLDVRRKLRIEESRESSLGGNVAHIYDKSK